ncbi:MAG: RidA family protein [Chitinophagaceae bacterium]|jgi:2-iminobutanoate/2-iminopropanoate deaminase|nr:RidA family protein [Chitinophagaceae bacterium]
MKKIYPETMPVPKGYYSPAIVHNKTVYVSGQLALNEKGEPQIASIEDEVRQCMKNIETILLASGSSLQHVLKVNVFIADISNWPKFNQVFAEIMGEHRPARIVVPCNQLNYGCGIEIDCIAATAE